MIFLFLKLTKTMRMANTEGNYKKMNTHVNTYTIRP